jgi:hypothetical protein
MRLPCLRCSTALEVKGVRSICWASLHRCTFLLSVFLPLSVWCAERGPTLSNLTKCKMFQQLTLVNGEFCDRGSASY